MEPSPVGSHVRRKFFDIHQAHASPLAAEAIARIGQLYAIETEIRGRAPDERRKIRQSRSRPLLESLHEWFESNLARLSAKSETASAIRYALARWSALMRFCDDGRLEIDNNSAERALRAVALGRKNYLFAGSDAGGERAAAMYSLGKLANSGSNNFASCAVPSPRVAEFSHGASLSPKCVF